MKQRSLSIAFLVRVLLILLVCQGGLFTWTYIQEQRSFADGLEQKVKVVSALMVNASVKGLSEFDLTYLGLLMDELLKDEDFIGMSLKDDTGFEAMERHKRIKNGVINRKYPVQVGGKQIGTLEISYSTARIDQLLAQRLVAKAAIQSGILCLIALFVFTYFRTRVARRISGIEGGLRQMTEGDLTVRIHDDAGDELGSISSGVNILGQRLADYIVQIDAFSDSVAETTQELDATFAVSKEALAHQHAATEEISHAVSNAATTQNQIAANARQLLDFSRSNADAVTENLAVSEEIAQQIDSLHGGINTTYEKILAIDSSSKEVTNLADQAAKAVENAVASASTIKASFNDIEQIVAESSRLSEQTTQVITDKGIAAVYETQQSMSMIFELSESLSRTISKLGEESKDIAKILTVITEITDKTKLLSLNASILAAQAGERGRGFAVVASEMKQLSEMTYQSTSGISTILQSIHHNISDAVVETGKASQIVKTGSQVVNHAGMALQEVLSVSRNSQETVACIRQATDLQQDKLDLVVDALEKLRAVNRSVSHASAAEEMNIGVMGRNIAELRDAMYQVRVATDQQVASMHEMMSNIEAATERTKEITAAVHESQMVHKSISASLNEVVQIGSQTVDSINNATGQLEVVSNEVENMQKGIKQFRI
jgi:methyl-accepting chemotaxis protein